MNSPAINRFRPLVKLLALFPFFSFVTTPVDRDKILRQSGQLVQHDNSSIVERPYVDPGTIAGLLVGLGKFFAGFFQGESGPTVADFAKNLSKQIEITNNKLDVIISQNEKVIRLINDNPAQTVSLDNLNKLKARFREYRQILTTLQSSYNFNIKKYVDKTDNLEAVKQLAKELKFFRNNLKEENNASMVPFIAVAINMEYYLRNKFLGTSWEDLVGELGDDKNWLQVNLFADKNSIENNLKAYRQERKRLIDDARKSIFYGKTDRSETGKQPGTSTFMCHLTPLIDTTETAEIVFLRYTGLLTPEEKSLTMIREGDDLWLGGKALSLSPQIDYEAPLTAPYAQQEKEFYAFRTGKIAELNARLAINYNYLVSNAATLYLGLKALEACNIILKVAAKPKHK